LALQFGYFGLWKRDGGGGAWRGSVAKITVLQHDLL
jgi:hypothetical protein